MKPMAAIKNPGSYIDNIKDREGYADTITVEHRSNNPKRDFLFVNKKQCKHIPCSPSEMVKMCSTLAGVVNSGLVSRADYKDLKILVIGFAETATAIGTIVGDRVGRAAYVLHTTREEVENSIEVITFEETHSHATTQKLLVTPDDFDFNDYNYILFVEDEISTGNTILNFINAFEEQYNLDDKRRKIRDISYGVASICNWQDKEMRELFKVAGIDTFALITGELKDASIKMFDGEDITLIKSVTSDTKAKVTTSSVETHLDTFFENRTGHRVNRVVNNDCMQKWFKEIYKKYSEYDSVRVIGTEECMETAIMLGKYFEDKKHHVVCHATTRSKIDVLASFFDGEADGIKSRYQVPSAYDKDRNTFIYNMNENYELLLLVTDSKNDECVQALADRLADICSKETKHIGVIRV